MASCPPQFAMNYHQLIVNIYSIKTKVKFVMWLKGDWGSLSQTFPAWFLSSTFCIIFYCSSDSSVRSFYYLTVSSLSHYRPSLFLYQYLDQSSIFFVLIRAANSSSFSVYVQVSGPKGVLKLVSK